MDNKARLREVQVQVYQGSKPKGPQHDITFDGEKICCGGAVIKVSPRSERRGREGGTWTPELHRDRQGMWRGLGGFSHAVESSPLHDFFPLPCLPFSMA